MTVLNAWLIRWGTHVLIASRFVVGRHRAARLAFRYVDWWQRRLYGTAVRVLP